MKSLCICLLVSACLVKKAVGWSPLAISKSIGKTDELFSRRDLFQSAARALLTVTAGATILPAPCLSAGTNIPSRQDLERLQKGHARVQYLLQNWDSITKVCGTSIMSDTERKQVIRTEGGGGTDQCSRTPLRVQDYMGYKSTNDPLFKAEKLLVRAGPLVDPSDFENYLNAVETYKEKSDQTALLAYTSSWGEANPNGGKEVIEDYLQQTKRQVEESEQLLRKCLQYLKLDILAPSDK